MNVINGLDFPTTIHWHGISQKGQLFIFHNGRGLFLQRAAFCQHTMLISF